MALAARVAWGLTCLTSLAAVHAAADELPDASSYSPLPGGYSLSYDKDRWSEDYSVFHLSVADDFGVVGSGFAASDDPRLRPLTRLDSAWSVTSPLSPYPLRIGDGVSSAGMWMQPARMGGIQIGSYQPAPPEVSAPPSLIMEPYEPIGPAGPTGPTTTTRYMDHLRALMGLQQEGFMSPGQGGFSLETGRLRENFEVRSDDYGPWLASGTYRYGVSDITTLDGEVAQIAGQQSYLGVGVLEGLGPRGALSAGIAGSRDSESSGWLAKVGADYSHDRFRIAIRSDVQSPGFQDVGDTAFTESLRQRTLASAGIDFGSLGRVSVASASETHLDDSRRDIVAVSHSMPFGGGGIVSTAAAYSPGQVGTSALLLSFTYPFAYLGAGNRLDRTASTALDHTIIDAFGQSRLPPSVRSAADRPWPAAGPP
jgi:outer membrane usher protein